MNKTLTQAPLESTPVWLISANDLLEGGVVYLTEKSEWSRSLSSARIIKDKETAAELLADIEKNQTFVVSPFSVNACLSLSGDLTLPHFRDRYRESGPTHRSSTAA